MKLHKIIISLTAVLVLTATALSFAKPKKKTQPKSGLKIVTTIFPEYDWVKQILGNTAKDAELTLLLDNGVDLHSYQPSVQDIAKISSADIFIYVGGESDRWVVDVLKTAHNKELTAINLLETLGDRVKEEELVEGMQAEDDEEEEDEEPEYDEHVWLSLKNAQFLCEAISAVLCEKDAANAAAYSANLAAYLKQLKALDAAYAAAASASRTKTVLFGDRFPFRYLVDDYGLSYYAAFVGCSAETEASFKTVVFLAEKVDELGLNYVFKIESGNDKIARTIIQNSKRKQAKILTLDSLQSTTARDIKQGSTYLGAMQKNLEVLKTALK